MVTNTFGSVKLIG